MRTDLPRTAITKAKYCDHLGEPVRMATQAMCGSSDLFDHRGILLGRLVQALDGTAYLRNPRSL